jgi:hypothetical protein
VAIRQEAGTGYVFGAYTAVDWPNQPAKGASRVIVSDPSGASFLFSLINAYDRPFRMSLIDRECAICVDPLSGPMFGTDVRGADGWVKWSNLDLMKCGMPANVSHGNCARCASARSCIKQAYQLDEWASVPPIDFDPDDYTLSGQSGFAAAEIEVYSM